MGRDGRFMTSSEMVTLKAHLTLVIPAAGEAGEPGTRASRLKTQTTAPELADPGSALRPSGMTNERVRIHRPPSSRYHCPASAPSVSKWAAM